MKIERKWVFVAGPAVLLVGFALAGMGRKAPTQYITAAVERGEIRDEVEATGSVNAVTTVQVGSQVSGTIAKLNADFNSRVHQGEVIALIEPALFRGTVLQAVADSENAEANLTAARAGLEKAKAALDQAAADYDRTQKLAKDDLVAQQQLEISKAAYDGAQASVKGAEANVVQARAQVRQKSAAVSVARTNLNYTVIRSPIDGVVVARNVDVGQTVAASLQAPTIFTIAQDLAKMQVYAKVDESDVGRVKLGRPVTFKVDAYPRQVFQGTVSQIRMNPTVVQNVVTYDAVVDFANPDLRLFPGMTAYVTIPVASAEEAVKIPNAALHFRPSMPPEEIRALYRKYRIDDPGAESGTGDGGAGGGRRDGSGDPRGGGRAAGAGGSPGADDHPGSPTAIVWKLATDNSVRPVQIELGITDHAFTAANAILRGDLKPGDALVTRSIQARSTSPTGQGPRR